MSINNKSHSRMGESIDEILEIKYFEDKDKKGRGGFLKKGNGGRSLSTAEVGIKKRPKKPKGGKPKMTVEPFDDDKAGSTSRR